MGRPPRIPVMLPWECKVIYFLTLCVVPRCNALANDAALACSLPNAKTSGQMEHILRLGDAGPRPFAYRACRARVKRRSLSEMAETLVQRGL